VLRFTSVHRKRFTSSIRFRHTEVRNTKIVDIGEETQEESSEEEIEGDRESNEGNMDCNEPLQIEAAESVNLIPIKKKKKRPVPKPKPIEFENGGKYIHFGLESALMGESAGVYSSDANLLQFAHIYKTNPELVPDAIRAQVVIKNVIRSVEYELIFKLNRSNPLMKMHS
jgi:hypothetical protein